MIRHADENDIPALIEIQTRAMPDDLLPRLGRDALSSVFWPTVLPQPSTRTIIYAAPSFDRVIGFGIFTTDPRGLWAALMAGKWKLARTVLPQMLRAPSLVIDVISSINPRIEIDHTNAEYAALNSIAEMYLLAVTPDHQGSGHGTAIITAGIAFLAKEKKASCVVKTSDGRARDVYLQTGWADIGFEYRGRRRFWILQRPI